MLSPEYALYALSCYIPFLLLVYYPMRYFKRFTFRTTVLLEIAAGIIDIFFFLTAFRHFEDYPVFFVVLIIIFKPLAYLLIFKVKFGRVLFNLLTIVNYASFTVFFAKMLETILFPAMALQRFRWTNSVCILITELIFLLPIAFFTKRLSDDMIKDNSFDFVWNFIWVLPLALATIGFITYYHPENFKTPGLRFYAMASVICALIVLCQMMIYYCVAKMIRQQQSVHQLEQEIYHQSLQTIQVKKVEEKIKDTRILRHDLRHHVTLMCHYVDQGEYEKLRDYLHQYSQSINKIGQLHYTDNAVLNPLLVYYADLCRSKEITFDVRLQIPPASPLSDREITAVFGNLIENAYHACREMDESQPRSICIRGATNAQSYLFTIDNTYSNSLKRDAAGNFATTKQNGSGIGILSVREILQKHGGRLDIQTTDQHFQVSFLIPK